jgi:hypothetical protein
LSTIWLLVDGSSQADKKSGRQLEQTLGPRTD